MALGALIAVTFAAVDLTSPPWYERIRYPLRYSEYVRVHAKRHGLDPARPSTWAGSAGATGVIEEHCAWTRQLMLTGSDIVHRIPGRAGWELRLVVQGGLRILDRIEAMGFNTFAARPTLRMRDVALMLGRSLRM